MIWRLSGERRATGPTDALREGGPGNQRTLLACVVASKMANGTSGRPARLLGDECVFVAWPTPINSTQFPSTFGWEEQRGAHYHRVGPEYHNKKDGQARQLASRLVATKGTDRSVSYYSPI